MLNNSTDSPDRSELLSELWTLGKQPAADAGRKLACESKLSATELVATDAERTSSPTKPPSSYQLIIRELGLGREAIHTSILDDRPQHPRETELRLPRWVFDSSIERDRACPINPTNLGRLHGICSIERDVLLRLASQNHDGNS